MDNMMIEDVVDTTSAIVISEGQALANLIGREVWAYGHDIAAANSDRARELSANRAVDARYFPRT